MTEDVWKQINAADNPRALWRGGLAVKQPWNQNGQYVKYTHNKARDGSYLSTALLLSLLASHIPKARLAGYPKFCRAIERVH